MKKLFAIVAAMLFGFSLFAQQEFITPDYDQIKKATQDKNNGRYYAKLAERFAKADTTLEIEDLQVFYYGNIYQDNYDPFGNDAALAVIRSIMNGEEPIPQSQLEKVVAIADKAIETTPAEPMLYFYKFGALATLTEQYGGDTVEMAKARMQFQMLFFTIASTGNGLSPEAAMHVLTVSHEYMMMNLYGFQPLGQALDFIDGHSYDVFTIDSNQYDVDALYFNIDQIFAAEAAMFGGSDNVDEEQCSEDMIHDVLMIPIGSTFELELVKAKRKKSQFKVLSIVPTVGDTVTLYGEGSLLSGSVPENHIVGYFVKARLSENSESVNNCLILKSNCGKKMLYYDTYITSDDFTSDNPLVTPTSNSGMIQNCVMTEIWQDDISAIYISNIRTKK